MGMNVNNLGKQFFNPVKSDPKKFERKEPLKTKAENDPIPKEVQDRISKSVHDYVDKYEPSGVSYAAGNAEEGLSDKAKELLGKLREQYGDYGFAVAGNSHEFGSMKGAGDKEYTVIFTADELEKMAEDEDYAAEQMKQVESLIDMTKKLENDEEFQAKLDALAEKGYILENLSLTVNAEGGVDIFAELSKVSEKQAERIEEKRAENRAEAKADRKAEEEEAIAKKFEAAKPPKKGFIKATSVEELMEKIKGLDDEGLEALVSKPAGRIDFAL
ncbi:MAG: hypothetical protein IKQ83_06730 [Lachnospiraceae bacterium]|nr:hypothetical protein [Lachnospiraceae bacterium]